MSAANASRATAVTAKAPSRAVARTSGVLQRKCACGARQPQGAGECTECSSKKKLQAKLRVGAANDAFESEADRIADHVLAGGLTAGVGRAPVRVQRVTAAGAPESASVPASVEHVLADAGHPLPAQIRLDMEQRFGHDFSNVRIHSGLAAEQSTRDVDALAYTVGHHIVFGTSQYDTGTTGGRRLLAHELTHVIQQREAPQRLQRWATCKPARLTLYEGQPECPPREKGEKDNASSKHMAFLPGLFDLLTGSQGAVIVNFDIGKSKIKASLHTQPLWQDFLKNIAKNGSRWKLLGFTDCHGDDGLNTRLRADRAKAVYDILPAKIQGQITSVEGASQYDCITENGNAADRTMNRSVAFVFDHAVADVEAEEVTGCVADKRPTSGGKKCKFYIYDSTEPTKLGKLWKAAALAAATPRRAAYVLESGKNLEELLHNLLGVYADKDCDCTDEVQFWSHGSPGNGMWISAGSGGTREFTASSFNIPELATYGDGPRSMPGYKAWHDSLTDFQRRLVLLRRTICGPDSEIYYRSCQGFQGESGQKFARASADFFRSEVTGHTKLIGLTQPGKKTLKPCQDPYWSKTEGLEEEGKKGKTTAKPK